MRIHLLAGLTFFAMANQVYADKSLTVMAFNLRYASPTPPNSWPERRPVASELIRKTAPDVIGTQEGMYEQLKDLSEDLPDYAWIGLGREGGSRGEFMAVFYRKQRLEPLAFDHFWLSDTPEVIGSKSWGNGLPRMVTWVRFKDRQTEKEFVFFNTHFDHRSQPSRERSAELVRERVRKLPGGAPILLVGDFNATAGANKAYDTLVGPEALSDTWLTAESRGEEVGTFNSFRGPVKNGRRIDWILSRGPIKTLYSEVVTHQKNGQYPSDHFPVLARVVLD